MGLISHLPATLRCQEQRKNKPRIFFTEAHSSDRTNVSTKQKSRQCRDLSKNFLSTMFRRRKILQVVDLPAAGYSPVLVPADRQSCPAVGFVRFGYLHFAGCSAGLLADCFVDHCPVGFVDCGYFLACVKVLDEGSFISTQQKLCTVICTNMYRHYRRD